MHSCSALQGWLIRPLEDRLETKYDLNASLRESVKLIDSVVLKETWMVEGVAEGHQEAAGALFGGLCDRVIDQLVQSSSALNLNHVLNQ